MSPTQLNSCASSRNAAMSCLGREDYIDFWALLE